MVRSRQHCILVFCFLVSISQALCGDDLPPDVVFRDVSTIKAYYDFFSSKEECQSDPDRAKAFDRAIAGVIWRSYHFRKKPHGACNYVHASFLWWKRCEREGMNMIESVLKERISEIVPEVDTRDSKGNPVFDIDKFLNHAKYFSDRMEWEWPPSGFYDSTLKKISKAHSTAKPTTR